MDEKWFYGLVSRMFLKSIPMYGVEPDGIHVHNKNHIAKLMFIVVTAFAPFNNNFSKGGRSYKVCCDRVATMAVAKQTSYKWHYADGSTRYTKPKEEWNISRRKGDEYLKSINITGSKEGSKKNPKFSLLKWWKDKHEGDLLELCRRVESDTGKRVLLTYQWDNASPHTDGKLLTYLEENIFGKNNWILRPQPPNSPIANVQDCCVFPAMAKHVSKRQAFETNGRVLDLEGIDKFVNKVFLDLEESMLARTYVHHEQVVRAIYTHNGGDEFQTKNNNLHFGVRKSVVPFYRRESDTRASGVIVMVDEPDVDGLRSQLSIPPQILPTLICPSNYQLRSFIRLLMS